MSRLLCFLLTVVSFPALAVKDVSQRDDNGHDRSIETTPSVWVMQAATAAGGQLAKCAELATSPWRAKAFEGEEFNPMGGDDQHGLDLATCGLAMSRIASKVGSSQTTLPAVDSAAAQSLVRKAAPAAFAAATREVDTLKAQRFVSDLSSAANSGLRIHLGSYTFVTEAGSGLQVLRGGKPWFNQDFAEGHRITMRATVSSTYSESSQGRTNR